MLNVVSACELMVMQGMRYPDQGADLERSFRVLRSLPADIWVTAHPELLALEDRPAAAGDPIAFVRSLEGEFDRR